LKTLKLIKYCKKNLKTIWAMKILLND
jgi:hypothetical protein